MAGTEKQKEIIFENLLRVLSNWLGFPDKPQAFLQASFLATLARFVSPGLFYLEATQLAIIYFKARVLCNRRLKKISIEHLQPFLTQLRSHPLMNPESESFKMLQKIAAVYNPYYSKLILSPS